MSGLIVINANGIGANGTTTAIWLNRVGGSKDPNPIGLDAAESSIVEVRGAVALIAVIPIEETSDAADRAEARASAADLKDVKPRMGTGGRVANFVCRRWTETSFREVIAVTEAPAEAKTFLAAVRKDPAEALTRRKLGRERASRKSAATVPDRFLGPGFRGLGMTRCSDEAARIVLGQRVDFPRRAGVTG